MPPEEHYDLGTGPLLVGAPPPKTAIYTSAAPEQPKWRQLLTVQPENGFLLTCEERYDRPALARCVRLATQNAYLTLQCSLAEPSANGEGTLAAAVGANDG